MDHHLFVDLCSDLVKMSTLPDNMICFIELTGAGLDTEEKERIKEV